MATSSRLWPVLAITLLAVLMLVSVAIAAAASPPNIIAKQLQIFGTQSTLYSAMPEQNDWILPETRAVTSLEVSNPQEPSAHLIQSISHITSIPQEPQELSQKRYLQTDQGDVIAVNDYSQYVKPYPEFSKLADELYEESDTDYEFISSVLTIVAQSTDYAPDDDTEVVSPPLQTLRVSKGDCEDLSILTASIIRSSSHTREWDIKLVYFDSNDPENANRVNHVALFIDTGQVATFAESTADSNGLHIWDKVQGWYLNS